MIEMREDLKGMSLSFTEIAKLVGKNWQNLTVSEKEPYEQQALDDKEKCTIEFAKYRKTESYKAYSEYLERFNTEQLHIQESTQEASNETSDEIFKVPKLESIPSASSTSTAKLHASSLSSEPPWRTRSPSFGLIQRPGVSNGPAMQTPMAPRTQAQTSVGGRSTTLTGYCDTGIEATSQTFAGTDHLRPKDISTFEYCWKGLRCENCGTAIRQLHDEKLLEPSAFNMTLGTPPRDFADTTTTSAIVSTPTLAAHDSRGGSQRSYSAYHVESCGYPVPMSGIEESIEKGSAEALHVAYATSNRSRGFGSSMTIPTQVSSLDANLATNAEAQISLNSAVQESIMDKSRPGEGWTEVTDD
ncbi:hypothetical protein ACLOAV_008348 [Pseudogymnoascus australis]